MRSSTHHFEHPLAFLTPHNFAQCLTKLLDGNYETKIIAEFKTYITLDGPGFELPMNKLFLANAAEPIINPARLFTLGLFCQAKGNSLCYDHQRKTEFSKMAVHFFDQVISLNDPASMPYAMFSRAYMHMMGQGGAINNVEAFRLFDRAIVLGNNDYVKKHLSELCERIVFRLRFEGFKTARDYLSLIWDGLLQDRKYSEFTEKLLMNCPDLLADKLIAMRDCQLIEKIFTGDGIITKILNSPSDLAQVSKGRVLNEFNRIGLLSSLFHQSHSEKKTYGYSSLLENNLIHSIFSYADNTKSQPKEENLIAQNPNP